MADEANAIFLTVDQNSVLYVKHRIMEEDALYEFLILFLVSYRFELIRTMHSTRSML